MAKQTEKLFSDFTAPSREEWREKIEVDLKGADYQKKMVWRTNEGFSMEPFYWSADGGRRSRRRCLVFARWASSQW